MNQTESNPPENKLPASMKEEALISTITSSGFPLQGVVAHHLKSNYGIIEEWSYIDRDSDDLRSLDVFAFRHLKAEDLITPYTALLIECKSSIHPYIFFQNAAENAFAFPNITGLRKVQIRELNSPGNSYQEVNAAEILGLSESEFGRTPPICSAFTQAIAKGENFNVSGTDPYNSIVMPLVKATDHAISLYKDWSTASEKHLYPTLIFSICVIDAPMVVVGNPDNEQSVRLEPWVRVLRQEAKPDHQRIQRSHYVIEIIHRGFFKEFFDKYVEEFLKEYNRKICEMTDVLRNGGLVPNLNDWIWKDIINE